MKKTGLLILLFIAPATITQAQVHFGFFGIQGSAPQSVYRNWGGGMSVLSGMLSAETLPFNTQFGGQYHIAGAGHRSIDHETGRLSFSNTQIGVSGMARFTGKSQTSRRVPYLDLSGGIQNNASSMIVHTTQANNHDHCTTQSLYSSTGLTGGAGAGILFRLSNSILLDVGLQWQSSTVTGKFVDMKSVVNTSEGISYTTPSVPRGMLLLRIGLYIHTNNDGCRCNENCKIRSHHAKTCYLGGASE
ncbi:MAG TPA: hypothetical protein VK826_11390 [Bacteroidia bacterium]|nr:hypothetical protein [Bacteroidia bacterium]